MALLDLGPERDDTRARLDLTQYSAAALLIGAIALSAALWLVTLAAIAG